MLALQMEEAMCRLLASGKESQFPREPDSSGERVLGLGMPNTQNSKRVTVVSHVPTEAAGSQHIQQAKAKWTDNQVSPC